MGTAKRKGNHSWAGPLRAVACGAYWPRQRVQDEGFQKDTTLCQRCQEAPETPAHRAYDCKDNCNIQQGLMAEQIMAGLAAAARGTPPPGCVG